MTKASTPKGAAHSFVSKVEKGAANDAVPTTVKEKPVRFTVKEQKFLKGMVEEVIPGKKTQRELAVEVYDAKTTASADVIASNNLSKVKFKDALRASFEAANVTTESMAQVISEAMSAKKTAMIDGTLVETEHADHGIRVTAARAAGIFLKDDNDSPEGKFTFNFNTNNGTQSFVQK